jgi:Recombination endonuclease VII
MGPRLPIPVKQMTREQRNAYNRARIEKSPLTRQQRVEARKARLRATPKICPWCKRSFPRTAEFFYVDNLGGVSGYCRECTSLAKHSIPHAQRLELYNGGCAICYEKDHNLLVLDHCHTTNKFRAVLCSKCNHMLGMADDAPWILEQGAAYLRQHGVEG